MPRFSPPLDTRRLPQEFAPGAPVRNVIFLLGDGMGFGQISAARLALYGPNGRLFLERFPATGWVSTHSIDDVSTDSAAGASALFSGFKTRNRMLSQSPDGIPYETVLEAGLARGMRGAVITTTTVWDASPAALLSHHPHRRQSEEIVRQMAASGVELLIGEAPATADVEAERRLAGLVAAFTAAGYREVRSWEELSALPADSEEKVLALLPPGRIADRKGSPTTAELAELALARISRGDRGFFLFLEDEDTDTHSHRGNLDRVVQAVAALDVVAEKAVEFARQDGKTLVLTTADHETGGLTVFEGREGEPLDYRWVTDDHSAAPVPIFAFGPGSERFVGVLDNTEIARILDDLLALELF